MVEPIVKQIHLSLLKKQKTIAVAESCTGGLVSKLLTELSESSKYFLLGVTSYSNQAKMDILRVPARLLHKYGAVSAAVAQKMAQGVRKLAKTDFGIGITGIAGPAGGTPTKPVGTVFIAVAGKNKTAYKKSRFRGSRTNIRKKSALEALRLLKNFLGKF
jgi:PncC family amidohydrolase